MSNLDGAWTTERVQRLTVLWLDGKSASEIARDLKGAVSRSAVCAKVARLGLVRKDKQGASIPRITVPKASRGRYPKKPPVHHVEPLPPRAAPRAPAVVDASHAKPWLQRGNNECAWIIEGELADAIACCAPVCTEGADNQWCDAHAFIGLTPAARKTVIAKNAANAFLDRMARKFA